MTGQTRILVVDDEPRGVELVARSVRALGHVETAESGEAGWALVQDAGFDLVISDQRMPGMSGVELLARVADRTPRIGRILLTGYSDLPATVDAINKARIHAYISKPCAPEQLRATAETVLERIQLGRENEGLLEELKARNAELEEALLSVRELNRRVLESERLSAIGSMLAQVVHDFRSPLSVLCSSSRALSDASRDADEVRRIAKEILEEGERMTRMCAELQDVTRVSDGFSERVMEEFDDVVAAALASLCHDASVQGVRIESDLRSRAYFALDEDRFRRVILNLGYNALDAMPDGGELSVATGIVDGRLRLTVRDTGAGIPEDVRERIFEPFVTFGKKNGSGLGLAIVKKIVEEHEGTIELGKPEGAGTAFILRFPIAPGE